CSPPLFGSGRRHQLGRDVCHVCGLVDPGVYPLYGLSKVPGRGDQHDGAKRMMLAVERSYGVTQHQNATASGSLRMPLCSPRHASFKSTTAPPLASTSAPGVMGKTLWGWPA